MLISLWVPLKEIVLKGLFVRGLMVEVIVKELPERPRLARRFSYLMVSLLGLGMLVFPGFYRLRRFVMTLSVRGMALKC